MSTIVTPMYSGFVRAVYLDQEGHVHLLDFPCGLEGAGLVGGGSSSSSNVTWYLTTICIASASGCAIF
jgi:hypothetical protein